MKILLDMDGVIADFSSHFKKIIGGDHTSQEIYHSNKLKLVGTDFYSTIPKFYNTDYLIKKIVSLFGEYSICTTPMQEDIDHSTREKLKWIADNLPIMPTQVIFAKDKFLYANEDTILIDDHHSNISEFIHAGGIGIHFDNNKHNDIELINELKLLSKVGFICKSI